MDLEQKIGNKSALVGIVGLGYVGLPLAIAFSQAGFKVLGIDMQQKRADLVNKGQSYIANISSDSISTATANNLLEATTVQNRLKEVDAICICVPTPLTETKEPDLSYVIHESEEISRCLRPGQLVILESTTYPGTTRDVVLPTLERSGLKAGQDFYLAYSPERIDPGNKKYDIKNTPKVVGGIEPTSTKLAELLYRQVADVVVTVSRPEVAEMTKVFENVFRNVNIALVNELSQLCDKMGISVWEILDAAASKPFGYMPFYPGPGIGGHCIPLDPHYLASRAKEYNFHTRLIELAAEINEQMPHYVTSRIIAALNAIGKNLNDARVLVLGVAYKKDVEDIRESPSLKLIQLLREKGVSVSYNDPYITKVRIDKDTLPSMELADECLSGTDCVVIATDHSHYDYQHIADKAGLIFDTRGATKKLKNNNIVRL
jgi:UDP-N-acetyl-D-glucosamine dehydrogenase